MRNKPQRPVNELGKLLSRSVKETRDSIPSFNDYYYAMAGQFGLAKANRYLILLFPNDNVQRAIGMRPPIDVPRLATTCKSITMNEQTWFTTEQNDINAGPSRIFPYRRNTTNSGGVKMQFNCGSDMFEKEFFEYWLRYIQDPTTRRWRYYDEYALGSEMYAILLPNQVANFYQAVGALFSNPTKLTGYKFTEVYPYSLNMNGGSLNYDPVQSPLYADVALMYHDVVPLTEQRTALPSAIAPVTENNFPILDKELAKKLVESRKKGASRAVNGFVLNGSNVPGQEDIPELAGMSPMQRSMLESYAMQMYENESDLPRAVDGLVVQPPPGNGALDLGLTIMSQVQGFFGTGFYGNGFNP